MSRILAEIDADVHRERLARLHADGADLADALILWDELEDPETMVDDVDESSFEEAERP